MAACRDQGEAHRGVTSGLAARRDESRSADYYIHEANQQIVEDFNIDRKEYTAQLLQVLHRVMEKGTQTNQMGAVTAAVAQAMKLARLDR